MKLKMSFLYENLLCSKVFNIKANRPRFPCILWGIALKNQNKKKKKNRKTKGKKKTAGKNRNENKS